MAKPKTRRKPLARRGVVAVAMILAMVFLMLVVTTVVVCDARDSDTARTREQADRAFFAADAGIQMAIREIMDEADEDGDGGVGTISNDGIPGTDPVFNGAPVVVSRQVNQGFVSISAFGWLSDCLKKITVDIRTVTP